jgi:DNA polymerase III delta prime subunit
VALELIRALYLPLLGTDFTAEEKSCTRDLFVTDPVADRNALRRRKGNRSPGTFNWLLEADALKTWLGAPKDTSQEDSDILWLYGNPGAGKSTAAITLTEQLPMHPDFINGAKRLAYFFCDSSSEKQRTAVAVLRGLLYQLITQHKALIKYLLPKYAVMGKQIFSSFDALWLVIAEMAACETDSQIYCIIDALDECEPNSQTVLLEQIYRKFNNFDDLDYVLQAKMRILITSRPYHEIRQVLGSFMCKDLASFSEIATDLELMIQEKVGILSKRHRYSKAVATEISLMLQYKAEGTFLWVGIACEELMRVQSMRAVKTLQALPRGLSALYQNLLSTAMSSGDEDDRDFIVKILTWVAYSQRPLTLGELSEACELFPEEDEETRCVFTRDTIDLCRLMVIVQDEHVLLLHTSVKDFLVNSTKEIDFLEANSALSYRCINRLIQSYGSNVAAGDAQFNRGFLKYAVMYWPRHAQLAGSKFGIRQDQAYFFQNIGRTGFEVIRLRAHLAVDSMRVSQPFMLRFIGHCPNFCHQVSKIQSRIFLICLQFMDLLHMWMLTSKIPKG